MRKDRLVVASSSIVGFTCLISEFLFRFLFLSPSDSEVFDVKESFEAELRSLELYALRLPDTLPASLLLSLETFEKPTAGAVEVVPVRPLKIGRTLLMGSSGE